MNKLLGLFLLALTFFAPSIADAATCFWVGGTGTWSTSNTASWDASSGGAGGDCAATGGVPKQATDIATFDASSGGGTVTVDSTINGVSMASIVAGAFTGTLDFSVNNPSMTLTSQINFSGNGTRKFLMGTGTFTLTQNSGTPFDLGTTTNLDGTSNFSGATYAFTGNTIFTRTFQGGGRSYGTLSIGSNTGRGIFLSVGANTWTNWSFAAGTLLWLANTQTTTITNAPTLTGTSSLPITIDANSGDASATISIASGTFSCVWCTIRRNTGTGGATFSATNSLDLGGTSGWTITPPSTGGGSRGIIGSGF